MELNISRTEVDNRMLVFKLKTNHKSVLVPILCVHSLNCSKPYNPVFLTTLPWEMTATATGPSLLGIMFENMKWSLSKHESWEGELD